MLISYLHAMYQLIVDVFSEYLNYCLNIVIIVAVDVVSRLYLIGRYEALRQIHNKYKN